MEVSKIEIYGSKNRIAKNFNYNEFWDWCRQMSKNNILIISEHNAPDDFKCIWSSEVNRTIDNNKRIIVLEKMFILNK